MLSGLGGMVGGRRRVTRSWLAAKVVPVLAFFALAWPQARLKAQMHVTSGSPVVTVIGRVVNAHTGKPVAGVSVLVPLTGKVKFIGTRTRADGRYVLDVPSGARDLTFSRICFREVNVDLDDLKSSDTLRIDIGLPFERPRSRPGVVVPRWACREFEGG